MWRREEEDRGGDLFRRADAARRHVGLDVVYAGLSAAGYAVEKTCCYGPRRHRVDAEPVEATSKAADLVRPSTACLLAT